MFVEGLNEKKEKCETLLKDSKACIVASENGVYIKGNEIIILTIFSEIIKNLAEHNSKEELQKIFDLAFMSEEELTEKLKKQLKTMSTDFEKIIDKALDKFLEDALK